MQGSGDNFATAIQLWTAVLSSLEDRVPPQLFQTWLRPLEALSLDDGCLRLKAPNKFSRDFVCDHYLSFIEEALVEVAQPAPALRIDADSTSAQPTPAAAPPPREHRRRRPSTPFHPGYTFTTFVEGPANAFAAAACQAVAENPGGSYNPLFLYGGTGLGKTHLCHAIANVISKSSPDLAVCYVPSEEFTNDLIHSLRFERIDRFHNRYRQQDVLLVDDIQFLAGKERTQEEFFHTFNTIYQGRKQIVLTADKEPQEIGGLDRRLLSRFQWGLIADIKPPDLETRVAILQQKAGREGTSLPDDVAFYLARHVRSNVRELEGCLVRLVAFSQLTGRSLSLSLAKQILGEQLRVLNRPPDAQQIMRAVASYYHLRVNDLKSKRRQRTVVRPRHLAMFLVRKHTDLSLPAIGAAFGGRDHSTVLNAVHRIERDIHDDGELRAALATIEEELQL